MLPDLFQNFLIMPFQGIYRIFSNIFTLGYALIAFSIFISVLLSPLNKWANEQRTKELKIQKVIAPQIANINSTYKGKKRSDELSSLYKRYSYNPLLSLRQSMNALVQVPILLVAFYVLKDFKPLQEYSFWGIKDLSNPDPLLFGLPLLPFVMTAVNLLTTKVSPFTSKEKRQAYIIAFFFLVILFYAPSALLIYWTCNNIISLVKVIYKRVLNRYNPNKLSIFKFKINLFNCKNGQAILPLSLLIGPLYLWSNNVTYFGSGAIAFSLVVYSAFLLGVWLLLCLVFKLLNKLTNLRVKRIIPVIYLMICSYYVYWSSKGLQIPIQNYKYFVPLICFVIFIFLYKVGKNKLNYVQKFLAVSICLISVLGIKNYEQDSSSVAAESMDIDFIKFSYKPNYYYFLCESFAAPDILKNIYDYDVSEFLSYLNNAGFNVYDDIYSNGSHTLMTLNILMSMNYSNIDISLDKDDANKFVRDLITGHEGNNLLKIFKNNGYSTALYVDGNVYFGDSKGQYLDIYDVPERICKINNFILSPDRLTPLAHINYFLGKRIENLSFCFNMSFDSVMVQKKSKSKVETNTIKLIKNQISSVKTPYLMIRRLNKVIHTPFDGSYSYKNREEWIKSNYDDQV